MLLVIRENNNQANGRNRRIRKRTERMIRTPSVFSIKKATASMATVAGSPTIPLSALVVTPVQAELLLAMGTTTTATAIAAGEETVAEITAEVVVAGSPRSATAAMSLVASTRAQVPAPLDGRVPENWSTNG